jgi:hypothetical protein
MNFLKVEELRNCRGQKIDHEVRLDVVEDQVVVNDTVL